MQIGSELLNRSNRQLLSLGESRMNWLHKLSCHNSAIQFSYICSFARMGIVCYASSRGCVHSLASSVAFAMMSSSTEPKV